MSHTVEDSKDKTSLCLIHGPTGIMLVSLGVIEYYVRVTSVSVPAGQFGRSQH